MLTVALTVALVHLRQVTVMAVSSLVQRGTDEGPVLLQVSAMQQAQGQAGHQAVSHDFFEDAQTTAPVNRAAPYDVGTDAVPLPNRFESTGFLKSSSPNEFGPISLTSASSAVAPQRQRYMDPRPVSVWQDREGTLGQQFVQPGRPEHSQGGDAQSRELSEQEMLQQEEAQVEEQQRKQRQWRLQLEQQLDFGQQQAATPAGSPSTADTSNDAAHFFESQGDIAGQEPDRLPASNGLFTHWNTDRASGANLARGASSSVTKNDVPSADAAAAERAPDNNARNSEFVTTDSINQNLQTDGRRRLPPAASDASTDQLFKQLQDHRRQLQLLEDALVGNMTQSQAGSSGLGMSTPQAQLQQVSSSNFDTSANQAQWQQADFAQAQMQQDFGPIHEHCAPQCSYKCSSPKCDEDCHPVCESPTCQTRCAGPDLSACRMNCGKPHCSVICPKHACTDEGCQPCTTKCSEPMCMLQCPKSQPCHNVCEEPQCSYQCKAPTTCPQPVCEMQCETPNNCMGSTYRQLPPLQPGQVLVQSFVTPFHLGANHGEQLATGAPQNSSRLQRVRPASLLSLRRRVAQQGAYAASSPTVFVPVQGLPAGYDGGAAAGQQQQHQQWTVQMPVMMNSAYAGGPAQ